MSSDLYEDLQISKGASAEEVKPAYRKLARQLQHDKNADEQVGTTMLCPPSVGGVSPTGQLRVGGSHPRRCTWRSFSRGSITRTRSFPTPSIAQTTIAAEHPCRGSRAVRATARTAISCSLRARAKGLRRALSRLCGWAHACSGAIRALLAEPRFTSLLAGEGEEAESERASERASKQETEQRARTHSYSRHVCLHTRYKFTYMIPVFVHYRFQHLDAPMVLEPESGRGNKEQRLSIYPTQQPSERVMHARVLWPSATCRQSAGRKMPVWRD